MPSLRELFILPSICLTWGLTTVCIFKSSAWIVLNQIQHTPKDAVWGIKPKKGSVQVVLFFSTHIICILLYLLIIQAQLVLFQLFVFIIYTFLLPSFWAPFFSLCYTMRMTSTIILKSFTECMDESHEQ